MRSMLLIAIGNTGRGDDGLGWAFADRLKGRVDCDIIYRYQLQVEDAELISHYEKVWFADASHEILEAGFEFRKIQGKGRFNYTTHALHPEAVVQLCGELYLHCPEAILIGISGEDFELGRKLTNKAQEGLNKAIHFFLEKEMSPIQL